MISTAKLTLLKNMETKVTKRISLNFMFYLLFLTLLIFASCQNVPNSGFWIYWNYKQLYYAAGIQKI
jgi:hypothetical protein